MKHFLAYIFLFLFLLNSFCGFGQERLFKDISQFDSVSANPKLFYFHFEGCPPCKKMDGLVLSNRKIQSYLQESFDLYSVYNFGEYENKIRKRYGSRTNPEFIVLDSMNVVNHRFAGYHNSVEFLKQLGFAFSSESLSELERKFAKKEKSLFFFRQYMLTKEAIRHVDSSLALEYLDFLLLQPMSDQIIKDVAHYGYLGGKIWIEYGASTSGQVDSSYSNTPCNPGKTIQEIEASIDTLEEIISTIMNDQSLTDDQRQNFTEFYRNCLNRVQMMWVEVMLKDGRYQELRDEYSTDSLSDDGILSIYSSYLYENKLDSAEIFLLSQSNTSNQLDDFITIQQVNLDRIQNLGTYTASDSVLSVVETIALTRHPYSGYAKSLYFWLTEEIISTELPTGVIEEDAFPRSSESEEYGSEITVSPNPFKDHLFIKYPHQTSGDLMIVDMVGNVLLNRSIEGDIELNTSNWSSGLYILLVSSNDEILFQDKFVLNR